jgi:hypothetical protein
MKLLWQLLAGTLCATMRGRSLKELR